MGDPTHPLLLVPQDQAQPLAKLVIAGNDAVVALGSQSEHNVEHGEGGSPRHLLHIVVWLKRDWVSNKPHIIQFQFKFGAAEGLGHCKDVCKSFV